MNKVNSYGLIICNYTAMMSIESSNVLCVCAHQSLNTKVMLKNMKVEASTQLITSHKKGYDYFLEKLNKCVRIHASACLKKIDKTIYKYIVMNI